MLLISGAFAAGGGSTEGFWDARFHLPGVNGEVRAVATTPNDVFIGGAFTQAGNVSAAQVARWTGSSWAALGESLGRFYGDVPVWALTVRGNELIVGGRFVSAGPGSANNVAVWNGTTWTELGGGVTGTVKALAVRTTNLVAVGSFMTRNGLNNVALWDGVRWSAPGADTGQGITGDSVASMVAGAEGIFVGGTFTFVGQTRAQNITLWDDVHWSALGSGVNGSVYALCRRGSELFAGGRFTVAGGVTATNIARWGGTNWSALDAGVDGGTVLALAAAKDGLLAGGRFGFAGGQPAGNLGLWRLLPVLRIARCADGVQLSWPLTADTGYILQATDMLNSPVWRPITNPPVVLGGEVSLIEGASRRTSFYRLLRE